jgi:hypothetical protein
MCQFSGSDVHRIIAACGYVCFFTGLPVLAFSGVSGGRLSPFKLRVVVLCTLAAVMVLPDIIHYLIVQPETLDLSYSWRHLLNPFRTITQWRVVESNGWTAGPDAMGAAGVLAYLALFVRGTRATSHAVSLDPQSVPAEGTTGRGGFLY